MTVKKFNKISCFAFIVLCLLIGMGVLVKASGSSDSCPNWPKCYGYWVPPSCECTLPNDYRVTYKIASGADFNYVIAKVWLMSVFLYTETFALGLLFIHFLISIRMRILRIRILVSLLAFVTLLFEMLHILTNIGSTSFNLNLTMLILSAILLYIGIQSKKNQKQAIEN